MYQPYQPYPQQPFQPYPYGQQPQQVQPRQAMAGRVIGTAQDVTPNDVPMDGSTAWFPLADGSGVIAKAWRPDGTIGTARYVPDTTEAGASEPQVTLGDVMGRLDAIEGLLTQPKRTRSRKVEDDAS